MPAVHSAFVDESKDPRYVVVCTYLPSALLRSSRSRLRTLLLPGEERIHFKSQQDGRRRALLAEIRRLPVFVDVYVGDGRHADVRTAAFAALAAAAINQRTERLVIESDDSVAAADRRALAHALAGAERPFRYEHQRPKAEPILWVSDAVAWCWQHRSWHADVAPIVRSVTEL